jgi:hypothetical protein
MPFNNLTPFHGMKNKDILIGFIIGLLTTVLGSFIFMYFFTDYHFIAGIQILKSQGNLGKVITLGCVLTLGAFGVALKLKREKIAQGIVFSVIALAILTLVI